MRLPTSPMLAKPGSIPTGPGWSYEGKWDGFRALVSTIDGLQVRSRRGWNMTEALPELHALPEGLILDGELVAFNRAGDPHFPLLSRRMLRLDRSIQVQFMIFDLLAVDGESITHLSYARRRERLEQLGLDEHWWTTPYTFDDAQALYEAVCARGLEGIVAKWRRASYRPGQRGWVKIKNPAYWRRDSELAAMTHSRT
jgi:bifunctional non-homologous end joining protein LigD